MLDKSIILVGYSGHGYVVADTILDNNYEILGYSDKEEAISNPYNLVYLGFEKDNDFIGWSKEISFALGIGDNYLRQKIADLIERKGKKIQTIIHKTVHVSKTANIGQGTFNKKNVSIN